MKKALLLLLVCAWVVAAQAQERKLMNRPYIDERRFHYGFFIGVHDQGLKLTNNGYIDPSTGQQWLVENDGQNFGFSVGILGEWKLNNYLGFRISPSMHFGSKHLKFRDQLTGTTQTQDMKSCFIGVPLLLKGSTPRFNNYRPYVLAGVEPMVDLTSKKHALLATKPLNVALEFGLGVDIYLPFFKLIPELKFCLGLSNILKKDRDDLTDSTQLIFTEGVDKAKMNMVVLSFYFE